MKIKNKKPHIPYPKFSRILRKKVGAPPGTIIHTGEKKMDICKLIATDYNKDYIEDSPIDSPDTVTEYLHRDSTTWLRMYGLHDIPKLQTLGNQLQIHQLLLEDIANTEQRAKKEEFAGYLFLIMRIMAYEQATGMIKSEQVSLLVGKGYVATIQESDGSYFDVIRERLDVKGSRIRNESSGYLAYAIIDAVVDYHHQIMALLSNKIELLEDELIAEPSKNINDRIHALRRDLISFRRAVWPMRDMVQSIIKDESRFIDDKTKLYLHDVHDHLAQISDHIDSSRDLVVSLQDSYMNAVSHKLNEVMKILTIISTIFIPLTFIAGIYGMNFDPASSPYNLPELQMYYGYPAALLVMAVIAGAMMFYFKQKDWF